MTPRAQLFELHQSIVIPNPCDPSHPQFAVLPLPNNGGVFVGKDENGFACLLVQTTGAPRNHHPPIRLKNLDVRFSIFCYVDYCKSGWEKKKFTVIRCLRPDRETIHYFFSICETLVGIIGVNPNQNELASAVNQLAAIFRKLDKMPTGKVIGILGELLIIWQSSDPIQTISSWRVQDSARYDFSDGNFHLEVKAAAGSTRKHNFSYDQCNPQAGTLVLVASLFTERSPKGVTLAGLIVQIEERLNGDSDSLFKLHDTIATTLGSALPEALGFVFDLERSISSVRFFNVLDIPALREPLPFGIYQVRFTSDLSIPPPAPIKELSRDFPSIWNFLPKSHS